MDSLATLKLTILYMLKKSDMPLSNSQICEFILEKEYASYFEFQQAANELIESDLLSVRQIRNNSYYQLTQSGTETLDSFETQIPDYVFRDVYLYFRAHHYALRNENNTLADYYQKDDQLYIVDCAVFEGDHKLVSISLSMTTEEEAIAICDNWQKYNTEIYSYLIQSLLAGKPPGRPQTDTQKQPPDPLKQSSKQHSPNLDQQLPKPDQQQKPN